MLNYYEAIKYGQHHEKGRWTLKIAYIDYWTGGIRNFVPLEPELRKRGHETILLHVGSFNTPHPKEEVLEGIQCRDISYYNTRSIYKMLEMERPDVIITLNTTQILDRVFKMSCNKLGITSAYLMHGIRDFGLSNDVVIDMLEKSYNSLPKKLKKSGKYFFIVIPNYLFSLMKYNPSNLVNFRFLKVIYLYFKNPGKAIFYPRYCDEIVDDKCLVYCENDINYFNKIGYDTDRITVVGNPKYDRLLEMLARGEFSVDLLPESVRSLVRSGKKYAVYLEEAFPEQNNMTGFTSELRDRFIEDCAERFERDGFTLVVKLHPCTKPETIRASHRNCILEKGYLDELIYYSEFCMSSMSTTINNCVLMDKPVLTSLWSASKIWPNFFIEVGVSNPWNALDDKLDLRIGQDAREDYKKRYISVLTPDAVRNVIRAIEA